MAIPFKVTETSNGYKLVSDKYKGKGLLTDKQPSLKEFSKRDQTKLKAYVRQNHPCVSIHGGKISNQLLQDLLKKSYEKKRSNHGDYLVDKDLSSDKVQVYHNPKNKHTVVAHRGTADIHDWITDLRYALGDTSDKRFQHSKDVQNKAYSKYGKENMTTIGHSLGSTLAEKAGGDSNEVVTLNKPVSPFDALFHNVKDNQRDIKTQYDPVSFLRGFQRGNKSEVIKSETKNPLTEHSTDVLNRIQGQSVLLRKNKYLNNNIKKMSDTDDEHCIHHYHHHIHHNSGDGVPNWLNTKKNGTAKFFTKTLPSNLIHKGIPAATAALAEIAAPEGGPLSAMAGKMAGDQIANAVGKSTGMGIKRFVKGSKEAKEFMASLRAKRGSKGNGLVRDAIDDIEELGTVIKKKAKKRMNGKGIPGPPSRLPVTDPSLM